MSDISKFLQDDFNRIRRSFNDYVRMRPPIPATPRWDDLDAALSVCDTLWIHLTIEVEQIHPVVWDQLAPNEAQELSGIEDKISSLMETIDKMEPKDPGLRQKMTALRQAVNDHIAAYEKYVYPRLRTRPDQMEMGGAAFRRWQELFEERPPRGWAPMKGLANTGWGGGGKVPNAGW